MSYRACQPLQMWQISHFCEIHSLSYEASKFFNQEVNGANLGRSCPPGVQLLPHFEVWSYRACQPLQVWWFIFLRNSRSELRPAKVFPMHCQWDFLGDYLPLGRTSYPRSLIKVIAHDSRLGRTFWHLIHGSVTKTVGGVARRNKSGRRRIIIISMSNNNTVLCH